MKYHYFRNQTFELILIRIVYQSSNTIITLRNKQPQMTQLLKATRSFAHQFPRGGSPDLPVLTHTSGVG